MSVEDASFSGLLQEFHSFIHPLDSLVLSFSVEFSLTIFIMSPSARGWQMIEIVTVLVSLCFISVVLRVVARLRRRVGFGVDDYLSILSMVLMIAMLIELCLCELVRDCRIFPAANSRRVFNWRQWCTCQDFGQRDSRELLESMLLHHISLLQPTTNTSRSSSPTNSPTSS